MRNVVTLALLGMVCWSCSNERETPGGQKFTILKKGDGKELVAGQYLVIDMLVKDVKDSVWANTKKDGYPITTQIQMPAINLETAKKEGLEAIFRMMTKGDSITFTIPAKEFFRTLWRGTATGKVDTTTFFTFFVTAKNVLNEAGWQQFQQELTKRQNEEMARDARKQIGIDTVVIDAFLKERKITARKTPSGLRYIIRKAGRGKTARSAQSAQVNYKGYLLDGTVFDTNSAEEARRLGVYRAGRSYKPYVVQIDYSQVIPGWHEILKLMSPGSRVTVYIPSPLAYGKKQVGNIKENSILVFDMEMVGLK